MEKNNKENILKKIEVNERNSPYIRIFLYHYIKKIKMTDVIYYLQDGGYWYVRIYVENPEGDITLEDCAAISNKIDEDIDKLIEQRFFLEVSSPGIERPLKKIEDYIRFKGEKAKLSLKHKVDDNKNFEGIITDCKDSIIYLELEDEKVMEIPFSEVRKANLVYEFEEF